MKRYSTFKKAIPSFPVLLLLFACYFVFPTKAQGQGEFDYIKKKGTIYYAVLELPERKYLVIGTRTLINKSMKIERTLGNIGQIELSVLLGNGKRQLIRGQIMDNGRNTTFYSQSSARQFVRRLTE
ncbi:hypothetical protein [Aliifodinibius sp. S!AR15-10]|uniref:hypothetical protein n=1 Tax=Aliifodinibius sp. S!AR15-10 TaxID=2950437 RepID=UPI0028707EDD|nr:hypothetical protein [Aliifodinibius sp. S!AR15-10]